MNDDRFDDQQDDAPFPPPNDPDPDGGDRFDPPPPGPEIGGLPPWEDRRHHGILGGFFSTVAQVMTAPGRFFTDHPVERGWLGPVSFAVILGVLSSLVTWFWSTIITGMETNVLAMLQELDADAAADTAFVQMFETLALILTPFTALISLFLYAGLFHLGVKLMVPDGRGFEATLRAVAYGSAAYVLTFVPMCGGMLASLWALALYVVGIDRLHGCGLGRATVIVAAPVVVFICGCGSLLGILGALAS